MNSYFVYGLQSYTQNFGSIPNLNSLHLTLQAKLLTPYKLHNTLYVYLTCKYDQ